MNETPPMPHPSGDTTPVLQFEDLSFNYPGHRLLNQLSGDLKPGVTLVQGGDGRGKTTLMRLLAGDLQAQTGQLQINGIRMQDQAAIYRQQLFWVDPRTTAFDQLTPLAFFESQRKLYPRFDSTLLGTLLESLDLASHTHKQLFMLSTGSKRKVWLATAFASGASVTLLDMPFAALDQASIGVLLDLLVTTAPSSERAWVLADYAAPAGVPLVATIHLGD